MGHHRFDLRELNDRQLLDGLLALHQTSAKVMADLLCHLAEVERRGLHLREATRSVFAYAVEVLHCTEDQAWRRVTAAQTAARFPVIFDKVASGELTLTAVNMLREVLTEGNHADVLFEATHKTKRQLEVMVARLAPKPDAPARLARVAEKPRSTVEVPRLGLPRSSTPVGADAATLALGLPAMPSVASGAAPTVTPTAAPSVAPSPALLDPERAATPPTRPDPARLAPLSPERWKLSLTIGADAERALRTARDLTPGGDLARIVERAVIEYAERLEARKRAKLKGRKRRSAAAPTTDATAPTHQASAEARSTPAVAAPTSAARAAAPSSAPARVADADPPRTRGATSGRPCSHRPHHPRAVVREVVERDGGRCTYVSPDTGRRCAETANLEIHHLVPFARGGRSRASELTLRCAAHHRHQTVLDFGADHVAQAIARWRRAS